MIIINVQCDDCQATYSIGHELDDKIYEVEFCPFCAGEFIQIEEDDQ
jgi:Zn finger protein HypA/HybF involved in hydrogenase expression